MNPFIDTAVAAASRRGFLGLAAGGLALAATTPGPARAEVRTNARILILGAGAGGAAIANRLAERLDGARITVVDGKTEHWYQPGLTLVAAGLRPAGYTRSANSDWLPGGITWVQEHAAEVDPDAQVVRTTGGQRLEYDYLIVSTGLVLDWDAVEGFDLDRIGPETGTGAHYAGPDHAARTWAAMDAFTDRGGHALFSRPATEMKCAGAPLKYCFLTDDYLRRKGTREASRITYAAHNNALFSVPIVNAKLDLLMRRQAVDVVHGHVLRSVDMDRKVATFATGETTTDIGYDFFNVIPPQRAPQAIRASGLSWADRWTDQGWIEVDMQTLRHARYPNVFGIGDINGVPKGKTAASVKWHLPVVEDHLVSELAGREGTATFNGYTSCPMITRVGRAMLIEFDYQDNLVPSFPGVVAPLEELWISWLMKEVALKATYNAMLRGRA
ncbi:NAD(P)/FAD-dependent oxidoreductase [Rhodobaculum claviforme]|uniref:Pyridine nucleotide-disulfide oxidoreductase n=1 Tax=Rhodobaculum claviforme TaxID=1549854 RepID=A0A934TN28_9RHOB|nr:FAD/NAD(P)-binding oxidoreductase [Rhodobaculum claviforme]MBK5928242.1 pyridine nucleotide-disulfide oxidoreductase [Rhodobaculum claviforme]